MPLKPVKMKRRLGWLLVLSKSNKYYYCPLNNYILHNIKRFMQDKPCFYQRFATCVALEKA